MSSDDELTLSQIQEKLDVPQHVLIHLCEKEVIEPDFAQTEGRGKWRRFSKRNLFEFAVALALRKYEIPVLIVKAVIKLLREYETTTQKRIDGFKLPDSIVLKNLLLQLHLFDGRNLCFSIGKKGLETPSFVLGFDIQKVLASPNKPIKYREAHLPKEYESELRVSLSQIAKNIIE